MRKVTCLHCLRSVFEESQKGHVAPVERALWRKEEMRAMRVRSLFHGVTFLKGVQRGIFAALSSFHRRGI